MSDLAGKQEHDTVRNTTFVQHWDDEVEGLTIRSTTQKVILDDLGRNDVIYVKNANDDTSQDDHAQHDNLLF